MTLPIPLAQELSRFFKSEVVFARRLDGGDIHQSRQIKLADGSQLFLKFQAADALDFLAAEADGLSQLAPLVRVPTILGHAHDGEYAWLALEWLDLRPHDPTSLTALGEMLGCLHATLGSTHGHHRSGYLGTTPLDNSPAASWPEFFLSRRLQPMLRTLNDQGHALPHQTILRSAADRLNGHEPPPSFLHGDLWTGNTAALPDGNPVVYDPSFHCGDAETDLAMLELFGGPLPESFLARHASHFPLPEGRPDRRPVYHLLHALNHLLMFGQTYQPMVRSCLTKIG